MSVPVIFTSEFLLLYIPEENTGRIQKHGDGGGSQQSATDTQTKADCKHYAAEGDEWTSLPKILGKTETGRVFIK